MREIKFRAYSKKFGKVEYVSSINWGAEVLAFAGEEINESAFLKDVTLMQYTGIKDRYGKEVYEGDILDVLSNKFGVQKIKKWVSFKNGMFILDADGLFVTSLSYHEPSNLIVVGNIYEGIKEEL